MKFNDGWQKIDVTTPLDSKSREERKHYIILDHLLDNHFVVGMYYEKNPHLFDQGVYPIAWTSDDGKNFEELAVSNESREIKLQSESEFNRGTDWFNDSLYISTQSRAVSEGSNDLPYNSHLYKYNNKEKIFKELQIPGSVGGNFTPVFVDEHHGFIFPMERSVFFETRNDGESWTERFLPTGYARHKGSYRDYYGRYVVDREKGFMLLSGYFKGDRHEAGSSPIYQLDFEDTSKKAWTEVARLKDYTIGDMALLENGDLLVLAYKGDIPELDDDREAEILSWNENGFKHLANLGDRTLFSPKVNAYLRRKEIATGNDGLVVINGRSFKNKNGDLPVYNVSYVSHDYGHTWERQNHGIATGTVRFDEKSGFLYKITPFNTYKKRP